MVILPAGTGILSRDRTTRRKPLAALETAKSRTITGEVKLRISFSDLDERPADRFTQKLTPARIFP
jgi:hypothetical protein